MEYQTVINYEVLKLIVSNAPELHEKGYLNQHDRKNQFNMIKDRQSCLTIVYDFFRTFDVQGVSNVVYNPKDYIPKGRLWADRPSVQGISRLIRHTICRDTMIDLDIKNAHPTILKRLCIEHTIPHEHLTRYINQRNVVLEECISKGVASSKDEAKRLMLKIMNGGGCYNINNHSWLKGFYHEMSSIRRILIDDHFPEYYEIAKKHKGKNYNNLYGSALNLMLCVKERELLDKMIAFCDENKLKIGALCHDGLMLIKKETIDYHDYAKKMTEKCGIEIVVKEMDELIPLENVVMKDMDYFIDTIDPDVRHKLEKADNLNPYSMFQIYIQMRPSVIDNFKYLRSNEKKHCSWFEKKTDGRWFQNQDPLFLSKDIAMCFSFYCDDKIKTATNQLTELQPSVEKELNEIQETCEKEMKKLKKSKGYTLKKEKDLATKHKKLVKDQTASEEDKLKTLKKQISLYTRQKEYFQKPIFRMGVIEELRTEVLDHDILNKLDSNKKLIGFTNGVYDFETMCFRPIGKDDYIQKSTGYEFPLESNPQKRNFIENTFKSMFIRKYAIRLTNPEYDEEDDPEQVENYECAMDSIAYSLVGGNDLQRFYIWIGEGSNGKSVTQNAIKHTMGQYSTTIDVCAITHSKNSSNATSDLPKAKGCRFLFTSESESSDVLSQAYVKRLTGREDICEREVFEKSITFTPQFVAFLLTNSKPQLKMEQGIARRIQLTDFMFRFFSTKDEIGFSENQYNKTHFLGKDYNLEVKLQDCKEEFMLFLIDRYKDIQKRGITISKHFVNKVQEYMDEQDTLKTFLLDNFTQTLDDALMLQHKRLLLLFNESVPAFKRVTNDDLTKKMKELNIHSKNKHNAKYYYIRAKTHLEMNPHEEDTNQP